MKFRLFLAILGLTAVLVSCKQENKAIQTLPTEPQGLSESDLAKYNAQGKEIAAASFKTLSGQLKAALEEGGVPNAVGYCNISAKPIIDSLSKQYGAKIRRTTLKLRNPTNAPTPEESGALKRYEASLGLNPHAYLTPLVKDRKEYGVDYYAPIIIKEACLKCHGIPGETLSEEHHTFIKGLYPNDKAFGYKEGDLRGIWSINFKQ
jgi:hypothetical protein